MVRKHVIGGVEMQRGLLPDSTVGGLSPTSLSRQERSRSSRRCGLGFAGLAINFIEKAIPG